jgi:hypothetical protein
MSEDRQEPVIRIPHYKFNWICAEYRKPINTLECLLNSTTWVWTIKYIKS